MILIRQSSDPRDKDYNLYVSEAIRLTVDPESEVVGQKLLSGDFIRASLQPELAATLGYLNPQDLAQTYDFVKSVRVDLIDSDDPNPVNNASTVPRQ